MNTLVSFEEIKKRYPDCHHEPRENCKYCGGKGIVHKKTTILEGDFACICIFVDHEFADFAQGLLNETIDRIMDGK